MKNPAHNFFYVPSDCMQGSSFVITGEECHHIKNVLRRDAGQEITFTDGKGGLYRCRIASVTKKILRVEVLDQKICGPDPEPALDVAFVPLKGTRSDLIIEKGTELGVRGFLPFLSRRAVNNDLSAAKLARFRKIAVTAMLQAQRFFLPVVVPKTDAAALTGTFTAYDLVLVADKSGNQEISGAARSVLIITGPEGGFDPEETSMMRNAGGRLVSLGRKRLRGETAALAGIVKILTHYKII